MCLNSILCCFGKKERPQLGHTRQISGPVLDYTTANVERMRLRSINLPQAPEGTPVRRQSLPADVKAQIAEFTRPEVKATSSAPQAANSEAESHQQAAPEATTAASTPALRPKFSFEYREDEI
ncbi:predicted protein [Coccidioides posadasii C735 delta SOWgp]|uniref:Uncharacterized protein n=1 Tax=Coccidioides posadasii (strain C735) TaxID=222929 RepID=C5P2I6_COCP7|nr:predicted protein [Coccidioides posadasii C735 delta SOWgp]EER29089.1 predicted protein [Coccidioides posadasii C735 delta SOWgp]|eukprot:XP_003071234.1 predicted protein [Coccidioides posadasii C735 delta SOWgp]